MRLQFDNIYQLNDNKDFRSLRDEISKMFELVRAHGTLEYVVFYAVVNNKLTSVQKEQLSDRFEYFIAKRIGTENYEFTKATLIKTAGILSKQEYPDNTQSLQNLVKAMY
jgi:hypothetical protein